MAHGLYATMLAAAIGVAGLLPTAAHSAAAGGVTTLYAFDALRDGSAPRSLVAAPDGRIGFAPPSPAWLASAGTGDVLAGMIAALRARGMAAFEAACAGVWLHGRAAEIAGPGLTADDLVDAITAALRRL